MKRKVITLFLALGALLLGSGAYVADYFWVENYKDVPVRFQHIFGHNLEDYIMVDHIVSAIFTFLIAVPLVILFIYLFLEAFDVKSNRR